MADYDISKAFETIENELIDSMMRNFKHHRAEEEKEGYNWSQWQSEQLKSLEQYRRTNQKKYGKQFSTLNKKIEEMLKTAMADGNAKQEAEILKAIKKGFNVGKVSPSATGEFFKVNDRKLDALINATKSDMEKAETAILRMSNDKYRKAIINAQVYANSGAGTYEKAVDMAVKDMLQAGLNCVEYRNGARHTLSDYADMAIRTANKRAYLYGEGQKRQEWGISLVVVNSRQGGCPDCAQYIGRVFIDDVYSGGSKADGKYPLLSEAIAGGLFHPRCKDSTSTYYEGITSLEPVSSKELTQMEERETLETKQQNAERQEKQYNRLAQHSLDENNKIKYQNRADDWHTSNEEYKEKIDEIIENSVENSSESDTIDDIKQLSLNDITDFENWQKDYYKLNEDVSFSRDENPAIFKYTGGDYEIINALERGGSQLEKVKKCYGEDYVESLNGLGEKISKELSKFKLNTPLKLKRSVGNVDYITKATSSVDDMRKMIGKTFTEKGFTSTTICSDSQLPFGGINNPTKTTLEIIVPKNIRGAYIYKISESPAEFEFLIDRNTTYKIIDAGEREISVKDYKGNISNQIERYMLLKVIKQ